MEIPKIIDAVQAAKMNHSLKIENVQIKAGALCYEEKALLLTENGDTACFSFPVSCLAGIIEITELIDADIIVVFAVVAALEHTAVQVLLFPFLAQHFIHRVRQRQCAAAGFVFHFLYGFDDDLAVFIIASCLDRISGDINFLSTGL